jgi:hypothetical protein
VSSPDHIHIKKEETMPKIPLPTDLPDALPDRGVLVLQTYPGWTDVYNKARDKFHKNVTDVYTARGKRTTNEYCFAKSREVLTQDKVLLQKISKDAGNGAVLVHFKVPGQRDGHEPLLRELEQELVHFLTNGGLIVSLIRARHPMRADALVHRPLPGGELEKEQISVDLKPYLESPSIRARDDWSNPQRWFRIFGSSR